MGFNAIQCGEISPHIFTKNISNPLSFTGLLSPVAAGSHRGAERPARAMERHREDLLAEIARLESTQDDLLDRLTADA